MKKTIIIALAIAFIAPMTAQALAYSWQSTESVCDAEEIQHLDASDRRTIWRLCQLEQQNRDLSARLSSAESRIATAEGILDFIQKQVLSALANILVFIKR
jgi:DnaJ-domain-containing protein 1